MLPMNVVEAYFKKNKVKLEKRTSHAFDAEYVQEWQLNDHEFKTCVRIEEGGKYVFIYSSGLEPIQKSNPQFNNFLSAINRFNNDTRCAKAVWNPDTLEPNVTVEMLSLSGKIDVVGFQRIFVDYIRSVLEALERFDAALKPQAMSARQKARGAKSAKLTKLTPTERQVWVGQYVDRDDDDEDFCGMFKIAWVADAPGDQHADTEVMLVHVENENECSDSVGMVAGNLVDDRVLARVGLKQPDRPEW